MVMLAVFRLDLEANKLHGIIVLFSQNGSSY